MLNSRHIQKVNKLKKKNNNFAIYYWNIQQICSFHINRIFEQNWHLYNIKKNQSKFLNEGNFIALPFKDCNGGFTVFCP